MFKLLIWLVTILAVMPAGLLSIVCLRSNALARAERLPPPPPGFTSTIASRTIEIGGPIGKVYLSTESWPALLVLCGIVLLLLGTFWLFPKDPNRISRHGLARIGSYVEQVLSRSEGAAVVIARPNDSNVVSVAQKGGKVILCVFSDASKEAKIRAFFSRHAIESRNSVLSIRGANENLCQLEFALNFDAKANTDLIRALFTTLFDVDDSMDLQFRTTGF
jgi:hypothetical protein